MAGRGKMWRVLKKLGKAVLCLVVLALCVVPCLVVSSPLAYIPPVMLIAVVVVSYVCLRISARKVEVHEEAMKGSCERGESVVLSVELANRSWVPATRVELGFFITDLAGDVDVRTQVTASLGPRESINLGFDASFAHLGKYSCGIDSMVMHDMVGLFSREVALPGGSGVAVRPRLFDVGDADLAHVTTDVSESNFRPIAADDQDYAGVREYRYGDPMKAVHWNLSSRDPHGIMYTRLFEVQAEPGLAVVVDPVAPAYDAEELMGAFDALVESAASVSDAARQLGVDAEVRYVARDGGPAAVHLVGQGDVESLIRDMMPPAGVADMVDPLVAAAMLDSEANNPHGRGNVAYCTSLLTNEAADQLASMRLHGRNPLCFLAVPRSLEGRARDERLAPCRRLAEAGVPYYVVETNEAVTEVKAR